MGFLCYFVIITAVLVVATVIADVVVVVFILIVVFHDDELKKQNPKQKHCVALRKSKYTVTALHRVSICRALK